MSTNTIRISSAGLATAAAILLTALPAAALSLGVSASASASSSGVAVNASASAKLSAVITKADSDISARITALNDMNSRVQNLKNVSATEKSSIATDVQTNSSGLTTLQGKIDADTGLATARTDAQSIFGTFRIYALVIPQGDILVSADRVVTITGLMSTLGANIQTRIAADQAAGKDVSALTAAYLDMTAKIADANTQSASAQTSVSALVPDQGNATVAASNHTALLAARADIKTATSDLQAARKDITTLLQGLKSLGGSASASSSVSTH